MTVSSTNTKNSYSGDGSTTVFAYTFKIFDDDDITVILRTDATGTETVQTKTTHYSVSGVGSAGGGNITFVSAPASGVTVVLLRETAQTQTTDYTPNDPFPAASHEDALDKLTLIVQDIQEETDRSIKLSRTNTMTSTEFTVGASDRANKILAFDGSGELSVTQELGTFQGNWAGSTAYYVRDIIKDTSNNNIYICNTAHTSSGSQPISTNTDSAKWDLLVDAASATTSATAAAASATAAAASETAAAASESAAATSESNAASSASSAASDASAAAASAASAAASFDAFDDIYLGAKSSAPTVDNDGDALTAGDQYFNTTNSTLYVWNGSAWQSASPDIVADITPQLGGDLDLNGNDITGTGNIDNVGTITTDGLTVDNINIDGNTIISTDTNGNIALTPNGTGEVDISKVDIDSGAIDGTVIGASSAAAITGTTITGTSFVTSGDMTFGDNDKAIFGAGSDLQIYHDGSNSYIDDTATGDLIIRASAIYLQKYTGETLINAVADGAAKIYYDAAEKLATTSGGIDVTGTVTADGLTVETASGGATAEIVSGSGTSSLYMGDPSDRDAGAITYANASDSMQFITNANERLRITSGGNVGIGTAAPSGELHLYRNSTGPCRLLLQNTEDLSYIYSDGGQLIFDSDNGHLFRNENGTAEFGRFDSSGNLLVGTTDALPSFNNVEGVAISSGSYGGFLSCSRDGAICSSFNRKTSDGGIMEFRKDGTVVGSIGTNSSDLVVHSSPAGHSGLRFGNGYIIPTDNTGSTASSDNSFDLGVTGTRFKDLYLSGGVYLGGTGASNLLDDYEEGTWTPTLSGSSMGTSATFTNKNYTKVGNLVYLECSIVFAGTAGNTVSADYFELAGLPFAVAGEAHGSLWQSASWAAGSRATGIAMISGSGIYGGIEYASSVLRTAALHFAVTYRTSA